MSSERKETYTCDTCGATAVTSNLHMPKGWTSVYGAVKADLCEDCSGLIGIWVTDAKARLVQRG